MFVNGIVLLLAAYSSVEGLQLHETSKEKGLTQLDTKVDDTLETNPCTDPDFPFAAAVGQYNWCYKDHHSAAVKLTQCGVWCTLDVKSGDGCNGCCGDISSKACKQQPATPSPTPDSFLLDFYHSNVAENNLGNMGPAADPLSTDASADYIRYKHVDTRNGMVDLVISNLSSYTPDNVSDNGISNDGNWAVVNIRCGTSTTLRFAFEQSDTGTPVTMEKFFLTVADLDQGLDGRCKESVEVDGYAEYTISDYTELTETQKMGGKTFMANTHGTHGDNPKNLELTEQQKNRAVSFFFDRAQTFTVTIATTDGHSGGVHGRSFMFAGATSLSPGHEMK